MCNAAIILDEPPEHTHDGPTTHSHDHGHTHAHTQPDKPTDVDMDKVRSTLKQIARDWAAAGAGEREACYAPIEAALLAHFSDIPPDER
jgi:carnosine N-methyltransferase